MVKLSGLYERKIVIKKRISDKFIFLRFKTHIYSLFKYDLLS